MDHTVARHRILEILADPDSRMIHRHHATDRQRERRVTAGEVHKILRAERSSMRRIGTRSSTTGSVKLKAQIKMGDSYGWSSVSGTTSLRSRSSL